MGYVKGVFVLIALLIVPAAIADASANEGLKLEDLVREALRNNPEIKAAESDWKASEYRASQSESLPDPVLSLGYTNEGFGGFSIGERPMARANFAVSQKFPFFGKLNLKGDIERNKSNSMKYLFDDMRIDVVYRVEKLFYSLYYLDKKIGLLRKKLAYLDTLEESIRSKYSSDGAVFLDLLSVQNKKYGIIADIETLKRQRLEIDSAFINILGGESDSALPPVGDIERSELPLTLPELETRATALSGQLKSLGRKVEAARNVLALKKRDLFPDFSLSAAYMPRYSDTLRDLWSVGISLNVPVFYRSKQKSAIYEAESSLNTIKNQYRKKKLDIIKGVRDAYSIVKTSEKIIDLYKEGLIKKAKAAFDSSLTAYESGSVDMDTVLKTLMTIIDYEDQYFKQLAKREKAVAELKYLTGGKLQ